MTTASIWPSSAGGVLVASPNTFLREQVRRSLQEGRGPIYEVQGGADALVKLESGQWQMLFLDRRLPDLDAEELIEIIKLRFPGIEVVMLDSDGAPPFYEKSVVVRGAESVPRNPATATAPDALASQPLPTVAPLPGMIGASASMQRLYRLVRLLAPRITTVLVTGATGTGKELVARAIHQFSPRAAKPWAVVNCAAIPEALLESELFGHVRGAFTGAVQGYAGRIHLAQGGTLFLDEVGELPLSLQAKLLRFLDQKEVQRLGSSEALKVDVRVVAATNADLEREVAEGRFRRDLYYRLAAFPIELPTLAERAEDIAPLAVHFLIELARAARGPVPALDPDAARQLQAHDWPGNVRELQQVMERAAILAEGALCIAPEHLYFSMAHCLGQDAKSRLLGGVPGTRAFSIESGREREKRCPAR
jgi:DNA-binding NtrC family response regulator